MLYGRRLVRAAAPTLGSRALLGGAVHRRGGAGRRPDAAWRPARLRHVSEHRQEVPAAVQVDRALRAESGRRAHRVWTDGPRCRDRAAASRALARVSFRPAWTPSGLRPMPPARARASAPSSGGATTRPVVGFLGRFVPEKGVMRLARALDDVKGPWRALFIGSGPLERDLRAWARRHGDRVSIQTAVGHDDVPALAERHGRPVCAKPDDGAVARAVRPHADRSLRVWCPGDRVRQRRDPARRRRRRARHSRGRCRRRGRGPSNRCSPIGRCDTTCRRAGVAARWRRTTGRSSRASIRSSSSSSSTAAFRDASRPPAFALPCAPTSAKKAGRAWTGWPIG